MKILHILYQSLPQISGSSIRSRDILMSQQELGLEVMAITSPFQNGNKKKEQIDQITYIRTSINNRNTISDNPKGFFKRFSRLLQIIPFSHKLKQSIVGEEPDVLHAHAMFFCGLPAIYYGWKYKKPVVYEVRSLWMLSKSKERKGRLKSLIERLLFSLELYVMMKVSKVIAINDNLKSVLVGNGIPENKIEVINNAVNVTLIDKLKLNSTNKESVLRANFGYIGTLTPHEGLDFLIRAFKNVNSIYPETKLLIFGSGIESESIKKLANEVKNVEFHGSINPDRVYKAFSLIDIIVNPRYKNKLTDSVTPLKPLEAMAYEKLVIASNVGGMKELIVHNDNGLLFEAGNQKELEKVMESVLRLDEKEHSRILKNALKYVYEEKSWLQNARDYKLIYSNLLKGENIT
ncbi:glycosyltransferase family 4 protein [uncultured Zobellia sp.]|uniref:glycosyltransferase family 4 protein n=1 Tax=uncultured Zobellia sp. TaxID=255433 RepID=UPI00259353A3|nr:glycosyltransferase family 4 protein [uncultured Zobellia sp.]